MNAAAPPTPLVRRANTGDLTAIGRLWLELMEFHALRDPRFRARREALDTYLGFVKAHVMQGRDSIVLVAEYANELVGFVTARIETAEPVYIINEFGHICDICVSEKARRLGVGRALFEAARSWFASRGVTNIRISVAAENPDGLEFWRSLGFRPFMERWWLDLGEG